METIDTIGVFAAVFSSVVLFPLSTFLLSFSQLYLRPVLMAVDASGLWEDITAGSSEMRDVWVEVFNAASDPLAVVRVAASTTAGHDDDKDIDDDDDDDTVTSTLMTTHVSNK